GRTTPGAAVDCSRFRVCDATDRELIARARGYGAVTVAAVRDQVNSVLDPSAGSLITASLLHASRLVGSDTLYEFNRGQFEVSSYSRLGRRGVFAWPALAVPVGPPRRIPPAGQTG